MDSLTWNWRILAHNGYCESYDIGDKYILPRWEAELFQFIFNESLSKGESEESDYDFPHLRELRAKYSEEFNDLI